MTTVRADFISGQVQENPLSNVATTLTMSGRLQDLPTVTGPDVAYLTIDPEGVDVLAGSGTEVVKITAYTHAAGTATIARGERGTTPRPHSQGVKITLSWMKEDLDEYVASAVLFDATNPTAVDIAGSAAAGSGTVAAHRNHAHNVTGHDKAAHDALDIDADTLDGHDSTYFLTTTGKAADSDLLDGLDSTDFVKKDGSVAMTGTLEGPGTSSAARLRGRAAIDYELGTLYSVGVVFDGSGNAVITNPVTSQHSGISDFRPLLAFADVDESGGHDGSLIRSHAIQITKWSRGTESFVFLLNADLAGFTTNVYLTYLAATN